VPRRAEDRLRIRGLTATSQGRSGVGTRRRSREVSGAARPRVRHEPRRALLEPELDLSGRAVSVLREFEVHDLAVGLLIVGAPLLVAPEEADQIRGLFDRT